jgi:hypothetical protein
MLFKFGVALYGLLDHKMEYKFPATVTITILIFLMIAYSHLEVGLYNIWYKKVELHLLYICLTFGLLHCSDTSGGELTTITYLIPLNVISFFVCEWIIEMKNKRVIRMTQI